MCVCITIITVLSHICVNIYYSQWFYYIEFTLLHDNLNFALTCIPYSIISQCKD